MIIGVKILLAIEVDIKCRTLEIFKFIEGLEQVEIFIGPQLFIIAVGKVLRLRHGIK